MSPSSLDESSLGYRGWRTVALCFALALFAWTLAFYGQSIYLAELQRLHGWSSFSVSSASTVAYLAGAVLVMFVGDLIERWGPRRFLLTGVSCLAIAMAGISLVQSAWQLYPFYLLMAFGWSSMSVVAISTLIAHWFDAKRGMAISLALNGASCGGIFGAPLLIWAIGYSGFTPAMLWGAGLMLVVLVPIIFAWARRPDPNQRAQAAGSQPQKADRGERLRTLRSAAFWSLAGPFSIAALAQVGFVVHLVSILEPTTGTTLAGFALLILSASAAVGRTALSLVIDRLDLRLTGAIIVISQGLAQGIMIVSDNSLVLLAACALFGLNFGNILILPPMIVQREFPMRHFALVVGLCAAVSQLINAFGPGMLGLLRDLTGNYTLPLLVCLGINVLAAILLLAGRGHAKRHNRQLP